MPNNHPELRLSYLVSRQYLCNIYAISMQYLGNIYAVIGVRRGMNQLFSGFCPKISLYLRKLMDLVLYFSSLFFLARSCRIWLGFRTKSNSFLLCAPIYCLAASCLPAYCLPCSCPPCTCSGFLGPMLMKSLQLARRSVLPPFSSSLKL